MNADVTESLDVSLSPRHCICPNESYTCEVNLGLEISWLTGTTNVNDLEYSLLDQDADEFKETDNFQVHFTGVRATIQFDNYTSILYILTPLIVDGTNLTCRGEAITRGIDEDYTETTETTNVTTRVCIIGNSHYYTP